MQKLYVAMALCLVLLLTACSSKEASTMAFESDSSEVTNESRQDLLDNSNIAVTVASGKFRVNYLESTALSLISGIIPTENAVYIWGCKYQNDIGTDHILKYSYSEGIIMDCPLSTSENGYILSFDINKKDSDSLCYLERIDSDDESVWTLHYKDKEISLSWTDARSNLQQIQLNDGSIYITDRNIIRICNLADGNLLYSLEAPSEISNFFRTSNDEMIMYCKDIGEFYSIKAGEASLQKIGDLPKTFQFNAIYSGCNSPFDTLIVGENDLYGWNIGEPEVTRILSFDTCGINSYNLASFSCIENGKYIGATWRSGDPIDRLFCIEPDEGLPRESTILRIAGLSRPLVLSSAIADFKMTHPEYSIEYTDYEEQYGDQALEQLQIDLLQGDSPDLLFVNGLPLKVFSSRGLLENLYAWIDSDDSLSLDDFTANLIVALENSNHNLYQLPQSYSIVTTLSTRKAPTTNGFWTFSAVNSELENDPTLISAFYREPRESLAVTLPIYMINSLVDYKNAQSQFSSDAAIDFLEFLNNIQPQDQLQYISENELDALKKGEVLFAQLMILSPEIFVESVRSFDSTLYFAGYPDAPNGNFYLNLPMAIPVTADEKVGAWEFMKFLFSSEYYTTRGGWLPLQNHFEKTLDEAIAQGISKTYLSQLSEIQESIYSATYYDEMISDIILDETSYMFAGVHSVNETSEQINRRVQLYLIEQYG